MERAILKRKKYVLLLGGSEDQLFIISTARRMGLGTVVVDANKDAPGLSISEYSSSIDFLIYHYTMLNRELSESFIARCVRQILMLFPKFIL